MAQFGNISMMRMDSPFIRKVDSYQIIELLVSSSASSLGAFAIMVSWADLTRSNGGILQCARKDVVAKMCLHAKPNQLPKETAKQGQTWATASAPYSARRPFSATQKFKTNFCYCPTMVPLLGV